MPLGQLSALPNTNEVMRLFEDVVFVLTNSTNLQQKGSIFFSVVVNVNDNVQSLIFQIQRKVAAATGYFL
jgi:hypothetical protein